MGGIVSTAAQSAANALPSLAAIRATRAADAPGARLASPAGGASPSYEQTIQVLELLQRANLPTELAICILDAAEYWPAVTAQMTGSIVASAGPRGDLVRTTLLVSPPLPHVESAPEHYARRISVWTDSRDQGFSSFPDLRGTRRGSSSWFELVLLRPSTVTSVQSASHGDSPPPQQQQQHTRRDGIRAGFEAVTTRRLHCNIHASHIFSQYITVLPAPAVDDNDATDLAEEADSGLDDGSDFVRQLQPGDRLAVQACAQYPMWVNAVRGCAIKVEMKVI